MELDGVVGNSQALGDFLVGEAGGQELQDLPFPWSERFDHGHVGTRMRQERVGEPVVDDDLRLRHRVQGRMDAPWRGIARQNAARAARERIGCCRCISDQDQRRGSLGRLDIVAEQHVRIDSMAAGGVGLSQIEVAEATQQCQKPRPDERCIADHHDA